MPDPAVDSRALAPATVDRGALAEDLLDAALNALRMGGLAPLVQAHPRAARWLMRRLRAVVRGSAGDALGPQGDLVVEAGWLLQWCVTQLRPDQDPDLDHIPEEAWLARPAWRPMLAVMCHTRLREVPDFPRHYHRRQGESATDNLCGLWGVDPSTVYRYLERGQRAMARLALEPTSVPRRLGLRRFVLAQLAQRWSGGAERLSWHQQQAAGCRQRGDGSSALWHALQAADATLAVQLLVQDAAMLAGEPEVDALVERVASQPLSHRQQFDLWMARATLARTRETSEHEEAACRQALALAETARHDLWRGIAQCALGRCFEGRDAARALAYYDESLRSLDRVPPSDDPSTQRARLNTLARVAYMRVRRNDPGVREVLEEGSRLLRELGEPDEQTGLLEQAWAGYWRAAGERDRALQCRLRALSIFERIGDRRSALAAQVNLMLIYAEMRDINRVEALARRILEESARHKVEPAIVISAHGNLGTAYTHLGRYDTAMEHFGRALALATAARHEQFANVLRSNLANACYNRFLATGDPAFEREGDDLVAQVLRAPPATVTPSLIEEARGLKAHVLGRQPERSIDQLLDDESAAHLAEMAEVKRQRIALASAAADPVAQAEARLAITRAYLAIAASERAAARALIEQHGLQPRFKGRIDALRSAFEADLSRTQSLAGQWKQAAGDLLDDTRRGRVLAHLVEHGSVNKSAYGELAAVAPATASKHLATLAERNLLVQRGKGPSTRYELPAAP